MQLIMVRHGETEKNRKGILNGTRINEPLMPESIDLVRDLGKRLPKDILRIYAGDLLRIRETADLINETLNIPISYHPDLNERDFGDCSDLTWEQAAEKYPGHTHEKDFALEFDYSDVGGEDVKQFSRRVVEFLERIKLENIGNDRPILMITSDGVMRVLYFYRTGTLLGYISNLEVRTIDI
ncbi:MAG: histidine phosphatase family protein [Candidatus Doudnabacteria bacterium]